MSNRLQYETSPYLLQHKDNPVDWYPWCAEAFERAKREDKPIFLSIGYSACHWCHVMAHESFENEEIAGILNESFVSIKVDKEERPDIDSVYMSVCQAFTGSGGWPTSIFMTPEQKPFFAGTYFPRTGRGGMMGFRELLTVISELWRNERGDLLHRADEVVSGLRAAGKTSGKIVGKIAGKIDEHILDTAAAHYQRIYDKRFGGFGHAPKFPSPHNILFLLCYYERFKNEAILDMAEHTLVQMYRGGMFDHIGFGFCRYSTDAQFLVPHFEKMLYDNALLILAYCKAYSVTKRQIYLEIAERTAGFVLNELTSPDGGFYSALDADSGGEEGRYYLFTPDEVMNVLGRENGHAFNKHFDITDRGNFDGRNIPNLLSSDWTDASFEACLPRLAEYRKKRGSLHMDDKVLTAWNGLMIAALCSLYIVCGKRKYLEAAQRADAFILRNLSEGDVLFVSFAAGKRGVQGFLDDYAGYIFAQLALYRATLREEHLERAERLCERVNSEFACPDGGYYLYGRDGEELILRPKESYDGAVPSGNSLMAYIFVRLLYITENEKYRSLAERQLAFIETEARHYPTGYAMYLTALLEYEHPPMKITVVRAEGDDSELPCSIPADAAVLYAMPTEEQPLKNRKTTYYVCRGHSCLPPVNDLNELPCQGILQ